MHVISRKELLEAAVLRGDLYVPLDVWYRISKRASRKSLDQVRLVFPSVYAVERFIVFNLKGNSFRLIAKINYKAGRIYIRYVLTLAEYDKDGWKR